MANHDSSLSERKRNKELRYIERVERERELKNKRRGDEVKKMNGDIEKNKNHFSKNKTDLRPV